MQANRHLTVLVPYRAYPANMGGAKSSAAFCEYLSRFCKVEIITTGHSAPPPAPIGFYPILGTGILRYANPWLFVRAMKTMKANNSRELTIVQPYFGWLGILLKKFGGKKFYIKSENIEGERWRTIGKWWWPLMRIYERIAHRAADMSFFITEDDRRYAITEYGVPPGKTLLYTYGTPLQAPPPESERRAARQQIRRRHKIPDGERVFLFNGTLDYRPNTTALDILLEKLLPIWNTGNQKFKLIVCGKGLPARYKGLSGYADKNVVFAGFVKDIDTYFLGADIFLNPVNDGGGIKTKLVDALALGLTAVSTKTGAIGVSSKIVGEKLLVVNDDDFGKFAKAAFEIDPFVQTPKSFYDFFNLISITERLFEKI